MSGASRSPSSAWAERWSKLVHVLFSEPRGLVWGAITNLVTTMIAYRVSPYAQLAHLMIIHLLGAVLISTRFGMVVSTFTAITGALAFDYFCIPPIFAFALPDTHSVIVFVGMLIVALTVCTLNQRLRIERAQARRSEARTRELCNLSLDLSEVGAVESVALVAERDLERLLGAGTKVLLDNGAGLDLAGLPNSERELARLSQRGESASDPASRVVFQLIGPAGARYGMIRACLEEPGSRRGKEQRLLLVACADRVAVAIERLTLSEATRKAQFETEAERLRSALLSAVSHDLKTPLSSILTAGTLLLGRQSRDPDEQREMLETIVQEAERMNGLVTNLLSVTRLESGHVRLNKALEALDDLIFTALSRFSSRFEERKVEVEVAPDLPLVLLDPMLLDQVLVNLIENVLRHTAPGSPLTIQAAQRGQEIVLEVSDRGPGIREDERERVFERFYRGRQAKRNDGGSGLGLTICRAVARAHGGRIAIHARPGGGTTVELALPARAAVVASGPASLASSTRQAFA